MKTNKNVLSSRQQRPRAVYEKHDIYAGWMSTVNIPLRWDKRVGVLVGVWRTMCAMPSLSIVLFHGHFA